MVRANLHITSFQTLNPIAKAEVTVALAGLNETKTTTSNGSVNFQIPNSNDTFKVTVTHDDYESYERYLSKQQLTESVSIKLKKIEKKTIFLQQNEEVTKLPPPPPPTETQNLISNESQPNKPDELKDYIIQIFYIESQLRFKFTILQ